MKTKITSMRSIEFTMKNCVAFKNARRRHLASLPLTEKIRRVEDLRERVAVLRKAFSRTSQS